ncbi:hypothetical protein E4T52_00230 [Aureobasidium sp. EXF-3400]|nr:hypothetical protein E4T51_03380 [Aureobasidium sp. EXF-12344]KAI4784897.1 hypothetical protein E4T52_00230 [Aureobasidium sp. EXF-3400]
MFINITVPSDTQKGDLRRAIRSQAALSSADSRKNNIAARATANSTSPEEQKSLRVRVRRKSKVNAIKDDPEAPRSSSVSIASTQGSPSSSSYSPLQSNYIFTSQPDQWNRSNPCLAYPCVDEWHPAIPQLVDTYLTYFAPCIQDPIYISDRPTLRQDLWPETLSHSSLFFANLLVASSHPSFSRERTPETTACTAWLRHQSMRSLQAALDLNGGMNTSNQLIAAVCLLCAWEFQYGDEASATAHMTGLKTMVNLRGGFHDADFPPVIRRLVAFVTYDQLWYSGLEPVFVPQGLEQNLRTDIRSLDLPVGFASFVSPNGICAIAPSTLGLVSEINLIMKRPRHRKYALLDVQSRLVEYNFLENVTSNFSPIQTSFDDTISGQAEWHIKLALLFLVSHLQGSSSEQYWEMSKSLYPEVLINTTYAEVGIWALVLICSTIQTPSPVLLEGLEKLVSSLSITDWSTVDMILRRYPYPSETLDVASMAMWSQMVLNRPIIPEQNNLSRFHVAAYRRDERPLLRVDSSLLSPLSLQSTSSLSSA